MYKLLLLPISPAATAIATAIATAHQEQDTARQNARAVLRVHDFVVHIHVPPIQDVFKQAAVDAHHQPLHRVRLSDLQFGALLPTVEEAAHDFRVVPQHVALFQPQISCSEVAVETPFFEVDPN